jgi:hypothetical protein
MTADHPRVWRGVMASGASAYAAKSGLTRFVPHHAAREVALLVDEDPPARAGHDTRISEKIVAFCVLRLSASAGST